MFYRPLVQSLKPVNMTWLCFNIFKSNMVKMAMQSSSQSGPMDMREPVVMSLKTWANCALEESLFDIFKVARKSVLMILSLTTLNVGPGVVGVIWEQCGKAYGCR